MAASVAVVTGGAGDIGRAIACKLCETHDHVVLIDINETRAKEAVGLLLEAYGHISKVEYFICDITDKAQVQRTAELVLEIGEVQTLVNNAGATRANSLHELELFPEVFTMELSINLEAAFLCFRAFVESLKRTRGSMINIASVNGLDVYGNPGYSAAKAGLIHFTKSVAVEYGQYAIRANAVAPGTVRTQAWDQRIANNPRLWDEAMEWYPLKHIIEPIDVANAVAFLAGPSAAAITGVCLPVDSGLTAGQTRIARTFAQSEHYIV